LKILFIRSNPVQPDPRVEKEVNSLMKAGYDVQVVAWDRSGNYNINESYIDLENGRAKIYRFGIRASYGGGIRKNIIPLFNFQIKLAKWLLNNRNKYDIIHACDFDTALVGGYCAKLLRKKYIYDIFDYYVDAFSVPKWLKKYIEKKDHKLINSADGVIICTEKRKEQIKGSNPKRLSIVHNSPSPFAIPNKQEKPIDVKNEKIKIAYIGILAEGRLLKELANVVINNSDLELHIGGFGLLEDYFQNLSREHKNIVYYGKLKYSKTIELENHCDIMTAIYDPKIPNHYYAAPNKFYEALMLGKPLIMVGNTGMDDIVIKHNIGEVINYDEESLKYGIENIIKRKHDWEKISSDTKQLFEQNYSWSEMEKRLINLYKSI
jgi:glycosyltransferase involved in cell wall biosynthesis